MVRKISIAVLAIVATLLLVAGISSAQTFKSDDNTQVAASETIDSAAYLFGDTVDVAGTINGDLYCAGQTVNISGTVKGDIFCAGQTINFSGTADGSLRLAGQTITISGQSTQSATLFAQTTNLADSAKISQDVNGGSSIFTVANKASIGRDLTYAASSIVINGTIARDVKVSAENLTLGSGAKVGGDIAYTSVNTIDKATTASVGGVVTQSIPKEESGSSYTMNVAGSMLFLLYFFIAVMVLLVALVLLFPSLYKSSYARIGTSPWMSMLFGLIALMIVPIMLLLVALTVVGIPLAIVLGLVWLVILLLSGSFSAYYLGALVLKNQKNPVIIMLAGGTLLLILLCIPIVGFFVWILSTILGVGIILHEMMKRTPKPKYQ